MIIAIPSYKRAAICNEKTLRTLSKFGVPRQMINVFVTAEEELEYIEKLDPQLYGRVIVGEVGLVPQRKFIERFYPADMKVIMIDDDIADISLGLETYPSLMDFFEDAFAECIRQNAYLWGVYPVNNPLITTRNQHLTTHLTYIVGAFYGFINRPDHPELELEISKVTGNKEDTERSIKYFMLDGKVLRFARISFKTRYYGRDGGGLGKLEDRVESMKEASLLLHEKYPFTRIKIRKNGLYEIMFPPNRKVVKVDTPVETPTVLDTIPADEYTTVANILKNTTIRMNRNGSGRAKSFGDHRAVTLGMIKSRVTREWGLSAQSKRSPELYTAVVELGKKICPPNFEFTSIHINNNVVCPRHLDPYNVGNSVIVSVGEYEGCNLAIDGHGEFDTCMKPLLFNGASMYHYNTPLISGNKYSLIYFTAAK